MTDYTLHYAPDNASLIIRLALEAQGVAYDTCLVDRAAQGQSAPAYRALNPHGLIPALQTPDGPMFETGAILFTIGVYVAPLGTLSDANVAMLARAVGTLVEGEGDRRGAGAYADALIGYAAARDMERST